MTRILVRPAARPASEPTALAPQEPLKPSAGPADWYGVSVKFYATSPTRPLPAGSGWGSFANTVVVPPGTRSAVTEAFRAAVARILGRPAREASITLGEPFGAPSAPSQPITLYVQVQGLDTNGLTDAGRSARGSLLDAALQAYVEAFRSTNSGLTIGDLRAAVLGNRRVGAYSANASEAPSYPVVAGSGGGSAPAHPAGPTPEQAAIARQRDAAVSLNEYLRTAPPSAIYDGSHRAKVNERVRQGQRDMGMAPADQDGKYGTRTAQRMKLFGLTPVISVSAPPAPPAGGGGGGGGGSPTPGGGSTSPPPGNTVIDSTAELVVTPEEARRINEAIEVVAQTAKKNSTGLLIGVALAVAVVGGGILYANGFFERAGRKATNAARNTKRRIESDRDED